MNRRFYHIASPLRRKNPPKGEFFLNVPRLHKLCNIFVSFTLKWVGKTEAGVGVGDTDELIVFCDAFAA